ncbi:uncharacterized protein [Ptychodera flava]|uniref:uncharacterized protein n=1 Tax=Ptychodera flava TaxID=63121 RepID=UPI00396A2062
MRRRRVFQLWLLVVVVIFLSSLFVQFIYTSSKTHIPGTVYKETHRKIGYHYSQNKQVQVQPLQRQYSQYNGGQGQLLVNFRNEHNLDDMVTERETNGQEYVKVNDIFQKLSSWKRQQLQDDRKKMQNHLPLHNSRANFGSVHFKRLLGSPRNDSYALHGESQNRFPEFYDFRATKVNRIEMKPERMYDAEWRGPQIDQTLQRRGQQVDQTLQLQRQQTTETVPIVFENVLPGERFHKTFPKLGLTAQEERLGLTFYDLRNFPDTNDSQGNHAQRKVYNQSSVSVFKNYLRSNFGKTILGNGNFNYEQRDTLATHLNQRFDSPKHEAYSDQINSTKRSDLAKLLSHDVKTRQYGQYDTSNRGPLKSGVEIRAERFRSRTLAVSTEKQVPLNPKRKLLTNGTIPKKFKERRRESEVRNAHLKEMCHQMEKSNEVPVNIFTVSKFVLLLSKKHWLMYCMVPKVGCTSWKKVLLVLYGKSDTTDGLSHSYVHFNNTYDTLDDFYGEQLVQIVDDYFNFLFVRHPFQRVLSAYRDKFERPMAGDEYFRRRYGQMIVETFRKSPSRRAIEDGRPTFLEFIEYLVNYRLMGAEADEHWKPITHLCGPCEISYDFIGKYESLVNDAEYVLYNIGMDKNITFPAVGTHITNSSLSSVYYKYYKNIPQDLLKRLYDVYEWDFKLFDYPYPSELLGVTT